MKYTPPNTDADAERFLPLSMGKDLPLSCRFSYLSEEGGDDVHKKDLHDRHAGKDHGVPDVWPVRRRELVRIGEDRRVTAGTRNDARYFVVRHPEDEQAQYENR